MALGIMALGKWNWVNCPDTVSFVSMLFILETIRLFQKFEFCTLFVKKYLARIGLDIHLRNFPRCTLASHLDEIQYNELNKARLILPNDH